MIKLIFIINNFFHGILKFSSLSILDGIQLQELLDQVRHRAEAAEDALEAAEDRSEKYRNMIEENNKELSQYREKVCLKIVHSIKMRWI